MADLNSYIVDSAGYVIDTTTRVKCLADDANAVLVLLAPTSADDDAQLRNIFGEPDAITREYVAERLEQIAATAARIAHELRAPQVDERESDRVGFDAAHSLDR